ncbi:DNA polymerase [Specibacter sp. RAF43]|uniref:DNA polymerase n=1 Tax=Specibacter sp. RAF43 TaxID=3233057 RepID=UPI003F952329
MERITYLRSLADLPALQAWLGDRTGRLALASLHSGSDVFDPAFLVGAVAVAHRDGTAVVFDARSHILAREAIKAIFTTGRHVWAHGAMQTAWALRKTLGVLLTSLRCSEVAARTAWPGLSDYSLGGLRSISPAAAERLRGQAPGTRPGQPGGPVEQWLGRVVRALPMDDATLLAYVAEQAVETALLAGELAADREVRPHLEAELAGDQLWRWTGYDGIHVDRELVNSRLAALEVQMAAAQRQFGFKPWADDDRAQAWVTSHGIVLPKTKSGRWALNKDDRRAAVVPKRHAETWRAMCDALELAADENKLRELEQHSARDGIAHPKIQVNAAKTGRMSIIEPALQNLTGSLRPALQARPGYVLVGADLSHVEPSIMAAASRDELLALHCGSAHDVYVETAAVVWGEAARDRDDAGALTGEAAAFRKKAKVVFLALGYGMGDESFGVLLGVSKAEAAAVRKKVLGVYKDLGRWIGENRRSAEQGVRPQTIIGRPLPECSAKPYVATNFRIQGSAKDVFAVMAANVAAALPAEARLWLPVHDELVVECLPHDAQRVGEVLAEHMQTDLGGVHIHGEPEYLGVQWAKTGVPTSEAPGQI